MDIQDNLLKELRDLSEVSSSVGIRSRFDDE